MFRIAATPADRLKCLIVRGIVFIEEQQVRYDEEIDEHDAAAAAEPVPGGPPPVLHILGELAGEPVAAGRLRFLGDWAKLERICVRPPWRGGGQGHRLVEFMLEEACRRGYRRFRMHAQRHLAEFYAGHGFAVSGEPFDEAGIVHVLMVREDEGPGG